MRKISLPCEFFFFFNSRTSAKQLKRLHPDPALNQIAHFSGKTSLHPWFRLFPNVSRNLSVFKNNITHQHIDLECQHMSIFQRTDEKYPEAFPWSKYQRIVFFYFYLCALYELLLEDIQEKLLNSAKLDFSSNVKSLQSENIC